MKDLKRLVKKVAVVIIFLTMVFSISIPTYAAELGDVDGNGLVNAFDALKILKHSAKIQLLTNQESDHADVNNDKNITPTDALYILRLAAHLINSFPKSVDENLLALKEQMRSTGISNENGLYSIVKSRSDKLDDIPVNLTLNFTYDENNDVFIFEIDTFVFGIDISVKSILKGDMLDTKISGSAFVLSGNSLNYSGSTSCFASLVSNNDSFSYKMTYGSYMTEKGLDKYLQKLSDVSMHTSLLYLNDMLDDINGVSLKLIGFGEYEYRNIDNYIRSSNLDTDLLNSFIIDY